MDTLVRLIEKDMDHELYKSNKTQKTAAATAGTTESKENSAHTAGDSTLCMTLDCVVFVHYCDL